MMPERSPTARQKPGASGGMPFGGGTVGDELNAAHSPQTPQGIQLGTLRLRLELLIDRHHFVREKNGCEVTGHTCLGAPVSLNLLGSS